MDPQPMPLYEALAHTPWRRLVGMMDRLGLPLRRGARKADAVAALAALMAAGGQLPVVTFAQRFGAVRPLTTTEQATAKPWLAPISTTEQLWWSGLIYLTPPRRKPGVIQAYALPTELLPLVTQARPSAGAASPLAPWKRPGRPAAFWWHSNLWLATIAGVRVRVSLGRWLPPTVLATVATRMGLDQEEGYTPSRSERQLPFWPLHRPPGV